RYLHLSADGNVPRKLALGRRLQKCASRRDPARYLRNTRRDRATFYRPDELQIRGRDRAFADHIRRSQSQFPWNRRARFKFAIRKNGNRMDCATPRIEVDQFKAQLRFAANMNPGRLEHRPNPPAIADQLHDAYARAQIPSVHGEVGIARNLPRVEYAAGKIR